MRNISKGMFIAIVFVLLLGAYEGGKLILSFLYETDAENILFVTPTGTGDGSSWEDAAGFRDAVLNRTATGRTDTIYVGVGGYDLNNVSDGTGTTIINNSVRLIGMAGTFTSTITLYNSHATATKILTLTSNNNIVNGLAFSNIGQASTDVIHLHLDGAISTEVVKCGFAQTAGAAGTGMLIDGNAASFYLQNTSFNGMVDYGLRINGAVFGTLEDSSMFNCGVGLNIAGVNDNSFLIRHIEVYNTAIGVDLDNSAGSSVVIDGVTFAGNTLNIDDDSAYGALLISNIQLDRKKIEIYPATDGVQVDTADGIWAWTAAAVTIIPADAIDEPFEIIGINIQSFNAAQTYKIEILYGDAVANTRLGIYEFTTVVGGKGTANLGADGFRPISTDSIVGAKLMSSTAGVDNVVVTLSYRLVNP